MNKLGRKLQLHRETLRVLGSRPILDADLRRALGAVTLQNCPTASACSNWCIPSNIISECETFCGC